MNAREVERGTKRREMEEKYAQRGKEAGREERRKKKT